MADRIKYIRTDRNGTKIYEDWTCPRCGGEGWAGQWKFTGVTCFRCGGSGLRNRPVIVKEYTDEYWAKLNARREAKEAKYAEEHAEEIAAAKAEQERREAEYKQREFVKTCRELGCGSDGVGYVHVGNTYPVKDEIKSVGGKFVGQWWVAPVEVKAKKVYTVRIDLNDFVNEYGYIAEYDARDVIFCIGERKENYEDAKATVEAWNADK